MDAGGAFLVRKTVVDHLTDARVSGWRPGLVSVTTVPPLRDLDTSYYELVIIGHTRGYAQCVGLELDKECVECGYRGYRRPREGLVIPEECWDGSDVLVIDELPGIVVVTERFRHVVEEYQHTGVEFVPVSEWINPFAWIEEGMRASAASGKRPLSWNWGSCQGKDRDGTRANTTHIGQAFESGITLTSGSVEVVMEHREVGNLFFPSGQVVACDPIHLYDLDPFVQPIAPGSYPVALGIAGARASGIQRVAFAMLRVTDETPVRWELATKARPDVHETGQDEVHGYGVDVGLGSLMDWEAADLLSAKMDEEGGYLDRLWELVEENEPEWANIVLDPATGLNVAVFSTGFGDGSYLSYWGYGESGRIACLVTDFGLLGEGGAGNEWAW